ncbi:arabinosyltransferase domain-containing protein [Labedaea rhizosphaerae]|uniref:Arabinosyltransferase C n=1 Tax=Labedaea rhizosphaerae TaxID=598644 RepID=A0A4R6SEZ8_LABRH|nr:arabinosyltransferase C [Labedaea rhizosphaerae]
MTAPTSPIDPVTDAETGHGDQFDGPSVRSPRTARIAMLAGLLGLLSAICAIAVPLLPVVQQTSRIVWPNAGDVRPVNAPLTAYWAQDLEVTVPCATVHAIDAHSGERSLLFATVPTERTVYGAGMQVDVENNRLRVVNRGEQVADLLLPANRCDIHVSSTYDHTVVTVGGAAVVKKQADVRPRIIGIYSGVAPGDPIDGLSVSIVPDTRYESYPTLLKTGVSIIAVLALIGSLFALSRMDANYARRAPRWAPIGWWRPTWRDVTVVAVLGAWTVMGPVTSDDGYIFTMARVEDTAGYLTNYYRWLGVAEAPFGWYYHLFQAMTHVSSSPVWMRLPAFFLGVVSWLLISREVMPRLGTQVRRSTAAGWAAAAVLLVWWLPYNNGLRPEPVAAVGSLLALCAVERALVTRRMLPLCLGLLAAALTLAATPTGLIAIAPFLVAARPLWRLVRQRARADGWQRVLGPMMGAGFFVLVIVFADQTLAGVQEATRLRSAVGPNLSWFAEPARYQLLFSNTPDGSVARRFPVLLLILCTVTCMVFLLRRGRIPGAALGPSRRLIATVAVTFPLMALTPTKWTHHFGSYAPLGAALAALTALTTSGTVLRSRRNRSAFVAALLVVAAIAFTGPNAYWYVSSFGVPWYDRSPSIAGLPWSSFLVMGALVAMVVAIVENVRSERPGAPPPRVERRSRALRMAAAPLTVICGAMVVFEFSSMATAIVVQKHNDSYSLGAANAKSVVASGCNLSDSVMVEREPADSILTPLPSAQQHTVPLPPQRPGPGLPPDKLYGNDQVQVGFHTMPVSDDDAIDEPPHAFTRRAVPMWSSYHDPAGPTGKLRTAWYDLTAADKTRQLVVAAARDAKLGDSLAVTITAEFGVHTPKGMKVTKTLTMPLPHPTTSDDPWSDSRIDLAGQLPDAIDSVRIVVSDYDLHDEGWIAITAPRSPVLTTLTQQVGDAPVLMDWPVPFVFPCLNPVKVHDGITDVPQYRITSDPILPGGQWSSARAGGPAGIMEELGHEPEIPTFLQGQPDRKWGQLLAVDPYVDGVAPTIIRGEETQWGWYSPGHGPNMASAPA